MIISLYAGLAALLLTVLTVNVVLTRYRFRVRIGDGGQNAIVHAIRAHSNFIEYAPIFLLLLLLVEQQGMQALYVHILGAGFVLGRLSHAYALAIDEAKSGDVSFFRMIGMGLTLTPIAVAGLWLLAFYLELI